MSLHQRLKIRASKAAAKEADKAKKTLPAFFQGSDSRKIPNQYLDIEECRRLKTEGRGEFINRGKAFRRHDKFASDRDTKNYKPSHRRGESLRIDEPAFGSKLGIMSRFVEGDKYAIAAVESWA